MALGTVERLYRLTVDGNQAVRKLDEISKSASSIDKRMNAVGGAIKGVFAGIAAGLTVGALKGAFDSVLSNFDAMAKGAQKVGSTTEELSKLKYAAELSGVGFESLQAGLRKFNQNIDATVEGTSDAAKALKSLGINATTLTGDALNKVADQFAKMEDGPRKTALAMQLFGKAGTDLIPMLNGGSKAIAEMGAEAEKLGIVIDTKAAKAAEAFNDNLTRLRRAAEGVRNQVVVGLLPAFNAIVQSFVDSTKAGDVWKSMGEGIGRGALWLTEQFMKFAASLRGVGTLAAGVAASIKLMFEGNLSGAKNTFLATLEDVDRIGVDTNANIRKLRDAFAANTAEMNKAAEPAKRVAGAKLEVADATKKATDALKEEEQRRREMAEAIKRQYDDIQAQLEAEKQIAENEKKAAADLQAKIDSYDKVGAAARRYAESLAEIDDLFLSGKVGVEEYDRMLAQLANTQGDVADSANKMKDASDGTGQVLTALQTAATNLFDQGFKNGKQVLEAFVKQLANIVFQIAVVEPMIKKLRDAMGGLSSGGGGGGFGGLLGSLLGGIKFAHGAQFAFAPGLAAYSNSIVTRPTVFPFAQGGQFGLMGERGAEAIMPLKRDARGDLGVGGAPITVNISNNAPVDVNVNERTTPTGDRQLDIIIEQKMNRAIANGRLDTTMRSAFGVTRRGA
jgi:phage-related minor tail protein